MDDGAAMRRRLREMEDAARGRAGEFAAGGVPAERERRRRLPPAAAAAVPERLRPVEAAEPTPRLPASTLTDSFGRMHNYLRISLTERCNLRCTYCMPLGGIELTPNENLLTTEEVLRLVRVFAAAGVTKVRFTGGEPSLRPDLVEIVERTKSTEGIEWVAMTTNAVALRRKLPALHDAGLDALNVSLDTLRPERFEEMCRRPAAWHSRVLEGIDGALARGVNTVKVNVVLMRGQNDDEIADFVEFTRRRRVNVRFIEYMPFDGNRWDDSLMVPYAEMKARVMEAVPGLTRLADPRSEVAKNFAVEGYEGSVSFVTSMTEHFCHDCNRVRLMADGNFKVCLFGNTEVSLRDAMRGGADDARLAELIAGALGRKKRQHAGMFNLAQMPNRPMTAIGG
eukprot:PRCOL_00002201-RA